MNVYDQAHGLAKAIKGSEEFKQLDEAKTAVKGMRNSSRMVKDFQTKQFELQAKQMSGQLGPGGHEQRAAAYTLYCSKIPWRQIYRD